MGSRPPGGGECEACVGPRAWWRATRPSAFICARRRASLETTASARAPFGAATSVSFAQAFSFVLPSTTGPCRRLHSTAQTQILRLGRTPLPSHSQTQTHNTIECSLPTHDAYQGSSEHSAPAKKTNPPRIRTRRPLRTPAATSSLPDATREAPQRPARLPPALSRPRPVSRPFLSSPIVCVATPARLGSGPAGSRPVTLPYLPRLSFSSQPPCSRASRHTFTPSQ